MSISISQFQVVVSKEETARLGEEIYAREIKSILEPADNGQVVAIHLPSHEYFLGQSLLEAADRLREQYPKATRGEVYARAIGDNVLIRARTPRVTGIRP